MAGTVQADRDRDVIVRHVRNAPAGSATPEDKWLVYLGQDQRGEAATEQRALVFARLLADLVKRPVWVLHGSDDFRAADSAAIRGCSCC
jgi:hypothetical protein